MSFLSSSNNTLNAVIEIFESFSKDEQQIWLKAMEREKLMKEAERLNKGVSKTKRFSVLQIVTEVNKLRKENGYKAYSV